MSNLNTQTVTESITVNGLRGRMPITSGLRPDGGRNDSLRFTNLHTQIRTDKTSGWLPACTDGGNDRDLGSFFRFLDPQPHSLWSRSGVEQVIRYCSLNSFCFLGVLDTGTPPSKRLETKERELLRECGKSKRGPCV